MSICMISIMYVPHQSLSLVERSAASWSALGTWKCSCFGNRGDLGVLGMCGCDGVIGIISRLGSKPNILMLPFCPTPTLAVRHLESWHGIFFNRKVVQSTIFRCCLLFFGGCSHVCRMIFAILFLQYVCSHVYRIFWYVLPQQPIHPHLPGRSQYWSWSFAGTVREMFGGTFFITNCAYKFVEKTRKKAIHLLQRLRMGAQKNW